MIRQLFDGFDVKMALFVLLVLLIVPGVVIYHNKDVSRKNQERILAENAEADLKAKCLIPFERAEAELDPACAPFLEEAKKENVKGGHR